MPESCVTALGGIWLVVLGLVARTLRREHGVGRAVGCGTTSKEATGRTTILGGSPGGIRHGVVQRGTAISSRTRKQPLRYAMFPFRRTRCLPVVGPSGRRMHRRQRPVTSSVSLSRPTPALTHVIGPLPVSAWLLLFACDVLFDSCSTPCRAKAGEEFRKRGVALAEELYSKEASR